MTLGAGRGAAGPAGRARRWARRSPGVDLLPGPDGEWYVLEVNAVPGWRALAPVTGVDVAAAVVDFAIRRVRRVSHVPDAGLFAQIGCIWEATARKPGNVHRFRDFADAHLPRFRPQRRRHRPVLTGRLATSPSGRPSCNACAATRQVVAHEHEPRHRAAAGAAGSRSPTASSCDLALAHVLAGMDADDAAQVYEAIRLAIPAGSARSRSRTWPREPTHDVAGGHGPGRRPRPRRPAVRQRLRRGVRRRRARDAARAWNEPARWKGRSSAPSLHLMAQFPDTLIARKRGPAEAEESAGAPRRVLDAGWPHERAGWRRSRTSTPGCGRRGTAATRARRPTCSRPACSCCCAG